MIDLDDIAPDLAKVCDVALGAIDEEFPQQWQSAIRACASAPDMSKVDRELMDAMQIVFGKKKEEAKNDATLEIADELVLEMLTARCKRMWLLLQESDRSLSVPAVENFPAVATKLAAKAATAASRGVESQFWIALWITFFTAKSEGRQLFQESQLVKCIDVVAADIAATYPESGAAGSAPRASEEALAIYEYDDGTPAGPAQAQLAQDASAAQGAKKRPLDTTADLGDEKFEMN